MEADKNPFPEFKLITARELLCDVAHFLFDHIHSSGLSGHNSGAAPALDHALYDQPELLNEQSI